MKNGRKKSKKINLSSASKHNQSITVTCVIYGKSTAPYHIPKRVQIHCKSDDSHTCLKCSQKKDHILEVIPKDEHILRFIDIHTETIPKILKSVFNLKCKFSYEILEYQSVIRVFVMPPTDDDRKKITGLAVTSYFIGDQLDDNCKYRMSGYTTVSPVNQTVTHVFTEANKERSDAESFTLDEDMHKQLTEFTRDFKDASDIMDYLEDLYDTYANNITKIVGRVDLHMAIDIAFRSPLSFRLGNEYVPRGWTDVMILGDSSCGKNYVVGRLMEYYGIGEMIGAENCSFAGLIGGLQQLGSKNWTITWGKIPLNDGRLLAIDEASELKHSDWTRLSRVRSEGVAEVTKINTQSTSAKTRLIFLANPIAKTIANYSHGIQALPDLVKQPEDIRRFDYVLIVAHSDVTVEEIHEKLRSDKRMDSLYTAKMEQNLILWSWSRKIDEITFSERALDAIYTKAPIFAKRYTFSIPLAQGENVRIKIAKLAICFAARMYSNKQNGKMLFVDSIHVDCALIFLGMIYEKASSGYAALSKLTAKSEALYKAKDFIKITEYLDAYADKKNILEYLLKYDVITVNAFTEYTGRDKIVANEVVSRMLQFDHLINVSEKTSQRYMKTSAFTEYIKVALTGLKRDKQASLKLHIDRLIMIDEENEAKAKKNKKNKKQKHKNKGESNAERRE